MRWLTFSPRISDVRPGPWTVSGGISQENQQAMRDALAGGEAFVR